MNIMPIIEYTLAFAFGITMVGLLPWLKSKNSDKWPALCLFLAVLWLVIDASAYHLLDHQEAPFALRYIVDLLAYVWGNVIFIFFVKFREDYVRERTDINSTTSGIQGTGLGLSVCKAFVDYMNGTIECESKIGSGTTFTVTLPFRVQSAGEDAGADAEGVSGMEAVDIADEIEYRGRKVLLVEDNELNREIAVDILEEEGMTVDEAEDGAVAVQVLKEKGPEYYDFILMDIQMPEMDGYEATKAIRAMYPDAKLPIIALSANAFDEDKQKSLEAGMDDHVAKPINIKELFAALTKFL